MLENVRSTLESWKVPASSSVIVQTAEESKPSIVSDALPPTTLSMLVKTPAPVAVPDSALTVIGEV